MPFISKDWRSPGEEWVRYEGGWELKKTILVNSFQKDAKDSQEGCEDQGADSQVRSDQVTVQGPWPKPFFSVKWQGPKVTNLAIRITVCLN